MRGSGSFGPISPTDLSGLQTLLSGPYIDMDPGSAGGEPERQFHGLEQPPIPTDQPGRTFTLQGSDLGWLSKARRSYP